MTSRSADIATETDRVRQIQDEHAGRTYFFCSGDCRAEFEANPERYVGAGAPRAEVHAGHAH